MLRCWFGASNSDSNEQAQVSGEETWAVCADGGGGRNRTHRQPIASPPTESASATSCGSISADSQECGDEARDVQCGVSALLAAATDPDLAGLVSAWPPLPPELRAAVLRVAGVEVNHR